MLTVFMILIFFFVSVPGAPDVCTYPAKLTVRPSALMEALSGSCLLIPCQFRPVDQVNVSGLSVGVWIRNSPKFKQNPENVIFNSSGSVKNYPMVIIGDLSERNCTTVFHNLTLDYSESYFFRVENKLLTATASCHPVQIKVKDSAWSPSITISGDLKEKESVSISCSAWTPCPLSPPELTWSLQQDSQRQTETNPNGTFTRIQENMTLSDTHDGSNITCSVRYPVDGGKRNKAAETNLTLSVSYAPKDTSASISPSGLVSAGSWVELSCSSRAKPPVRTFTWFRISKHGTFKVSEEQLYGLNVTEGGGFYCVAENHLGDQTSPVVTLGVKGTTQSLLWGAAAGGSVGLIVLAGVFLIIWRLKSTTLRQTQRAVCRGPDDTAETPDIHYGEMDFSKLRPSVERVKHNAELQNVVYSEVKLTKTSLTETEDHIYAQVKKKPVPPRSTE